MKCARSGKYFARAKVSGIYEYKSLNTFDYTIALNRLAKFQEGIIKKRKALKRQANRITVFDLLAEWEKITDSDEDLAASSKSARRNSIKRIRSSWPELAKIQPMALTYEDVKQWTDRLKRDGTGFLPPHASIPQAGNSSSAINKAIGCLGSALDLALKKGLVFENVARLDGLRMKETPKEVRIPSRTEFEAILTELKKSNKSKIRQSNKVAYCAEFLACSGVRIEEATRIKFSDINFDSKQIRVRGTKTETSDRTVPMGNQLEALIREYRAEVEEVAKEITPTQRAFPLVNLNKQLAAACKTLKIARITNHSLRHYFGTTCLEAGIPAHTVAAWLGHKDGGKLLLQIYAHLRDHHSREAIRTVTF